MAARLLPGLSPELKDPKPTKSGARKYEFALAAK
jgi:hypothetical protein